MTRSRHVPCVALAIVAQAFVVLISPLRGADSGYQIVERGEDFALHRKIVVLTNETGAVSFHTNEFTVLDHGLHFFEAGEWKASRDVVESFPDGAIARFGPCKTIFSPDMRSDTVFDIAMPDE